MLLIGPLDFQRVGELVFQTDLGDRHPPRAVLPLDPSPPDLLLLCGSWVGKLANVCVLKLVSRPPMPMNPTPHCRCPSANNSIACTNVSMLAGKTGPSRRFGGAGFWNGRRFREQQVAGAPRPLARSQAGEHLVGVHLHRGYGGNVGEPSLPLTVLYRSSTRSGPRSDRFATAPGCAAVPRSSRNTPGSAPPPRILVFFRVSPTQGSGFHLPRLIRDALLLSRSTITRSKGNGAEHRSIRRISQRGGLSGVGPGIRRNMP